MEIVIEPEYIINFFGFQISNTLFTSIVVSCLLVILAFLLRMRYQNNSHFKRIVNHYVNNYLEYISSITKNNSFAQRIFPLIVTLFIFIISTNLLALLPGFLGSFVVENGTKQVPLLRSPNSDLNQTIALAIISVLAIQIYSVRYLGIKKYIKRFINFSSFQSLIKGFFEIISEFIKVVSFSFRLFGNIFAGEVLLLIISFLIPFVGPLPFMILEIFVGSIQAFIFATLTLVFIVTSSVYVIE